MNQVTRTITSAISTPDPPYERIWNMLLYLAKLENRPQSLAETAHGWCAVICEKQDWGSWEAGKPSSSSLWRLPFVAVIQGKTGTTSISLTPYITKNLLSQSSRLARMKQLRIFSVLSPHSK